MAEVVVLNPVTEGTAQYNEQFSEKLVNSYVAVLARSISSAEGFPTKKLLFSRSYCGDQLLSTFCQGIGLLLPAGAPAGDPRPNEGEEVVAWRAGVSASKFQPLQEIDLTSCNLTLASLPLILGLVQVLPNLQKLILTDNFRSQKPGDSEPSKYFCVPWKANERKDLDEILVNPLLTAWKEHKCLATVKIDPWLYRYHSNYQRHEVAMRVRLRELAFKARHGDGKGKQQGGGTVNDETAFQQRTLPEKLMKAASAASERSLVVRDSQKSNNSNSTWRDRLIQLQVSEGKERERIADKEYISREKLRQTVRGRSKSVMPPDGGGDTSVVLNPSTTLTPGGGETSSSSTSGGGGGGSSGTSNTSTTTRIRSGSRGVEGTFASLASLEDEIRMMIVQKELDARRKVISRFQRR